MNILYISHSNMGGGASVALANIVKGMTSMGHKVWVLTEYKDGPLPEMIRVAGGSVLYAPISLTIYPMWGRFHGKVKRLLLSIISWRHSRKLIREIIRQYDIQLVHTNVGPMNLALKACQKAGIPHIWHLREYQDLSLKMHFYPTKGAFRKLIQEKGNYNVAISKGVFDYYGLRPGIDTIVYDGVFPEAVTKESCIREKGEFFLFVGRIEESKCPHTILKPFAEFRQKYPNFSLKMAGGYTETSVYYQQMKTMVSECNLNGFVEFLGNRDDVYDLMQKARALIVPSRFEGFGFITAEGMLNNCLVIGRNTAGTKEQFDLGFSVTGEEIGFRYNDENELLQCMFKAVQEDTIHMQELAHSVVVQNYTLEKCVSNLNAFYAKSIKDYYKENQFMIEKLLGDALQ